MARQDYYVASYIHLFYIKDLCGGLTGVTDGTFIVI